MFPADVYDKMLGDVEGGDFIKRSFKVMFISMILESNLCGSVNTDYFNQLEDLK